MDSRDAFFEYLSSISDREERRIREYVGTEVADSRWIDTYGIDEELTDEYWDMALSMASDIDWHEYKD